MKVFISHAAKDSAAAETLAKALTEQGHGVVYPNDDLFPGDNWSLKIGRALEEAKAMVVLLSPDAMASPSVQGEISYAIASPRFKGRLIPVMLRKTTHFPWILKKLQVVPFVPEIISDRLRARAPSGRIAFPRPARPALQSVP